ncbi:MAG: SulP family inorganic anion transporter [Leadbetterella sp.]
MQLRYLKEDTISGIVVFFVALPLCLGISVASKVPPFSGLIAGIIGGIAVGALSKSRIGVSGPAAGLITIVAGAMVSIGSLEGFLVAVVLSGIFQILLGMVGAGKMAFYFPSSVIKGMLAAIGIIIIMKQIPHAMGVDKDYVGDFSFFQEDGENTITELFNVFNFMNTHAVFVSFISFTILILWDSKFIKRIKPLGLIPAALLCVIFGICYTSFYPQVLEQEHLVKIPITSSVESFLDQFTMPSFNALSNWRVWLTGAIIAGIGSVETLLCVEATDKLDPESSITPTRQELFAQGIGNIVSGMIGGLPITQVIVRSSANISAGAKTKFSAIIHGILLLCCVAFIPQILNKIPLSALAAVLILVGYKLAKPSTFIAIFKEGGLQFIPFIITVIAIVATDLLIGIGIGLTVGLGVVMYYNLRSAVVVSKTKGHLKIDIVKDALFYNRAKIMEELSLVQEGSKVTIDASKAKYIDFDIYEAVTDYQKGSFKSNLNVEVIGFEKNKTHFKTKL